MAIYAENSRKDYTMSTKPLYISEKVMRHLQDSFAYSLNQAVKTLKLNNPNMNAVVLANFDVDEKTNNWLSTSRLVV